MRKIAISVGFALCSVIPAVAQATAPTGATLTPPATPAPVTSGATTSTPPPNPTTDTGKAPTLKINGVSLPAVKVDAKEGGTPEASLGDSITINTDAQLGPYLDFAAKQKKEVTLYLNGKDTGITPEAIARGKDAGHLQFYLRRNGDNKAVWEPLIRHPFEHEGKRRVEASIGISPSPAIDAENSAFTLVVVRKTVGYVWFWFAFMLLVLIVFVWLVKKYCLLCDVPNGPYSLGRCQMAWWFFLIIIAYVLIWLISGDRDTITASLLTLMGISAATGLGAVMIDSTNAGAPPAVPPVTHGFLRDILGDSQGNIGLHRFQIVVWTIVLGLIFSVSVLNDLTMPEFNATLLAAMGISAGTYLGFKFPEK